MEEFEQHRLKLLLFDPSKIISHVHVFGENGSGRSEIIRQLLSDADEDWVCVSGDFLYADGSVKLLLESMAAELGFKTRGDRAENFFCNIYENVAWPDEESKKIIIFLDNAQAIVNYPPSSVQRLFDSNKVLEDLTVRFVTSAPSAFNQYQIHLGHLPVVEVHIPPPSPETTKKLICEANPSIAPQFVNIAVQLFFIFCKSPNNLLKIISEAWELYESRGDSEKLDMNRARDCLNKAARKKLGNDVAEVKATGAVDHSFESMPLSMRYLLVAAYCASNNPPQSDGRYFTKNHGRDKRSEKKELRAEENRITKEAGPKAADLQRIVCIYETLLMLNEISVSGFDVKNVIASLDSMGLVAVTNRSNLDTPKIKCLISLESALKIAGSLNVQLRNYLEYSN